MKVLIALDSSACSEAALQSVLSDRWQPGSQFLALSVVPVLASPSYDGTPLWQEMHTIERKDTKLAEHIVSDAANRLRASMAQCSVEEIIEHGHVPEKIIAVAKETNADLIVLGSHGLTGLNKLLLGSVAAEVSQRAPCSVRIVKPAPCLTRHCTPVTPDRSKVNY